MRNTIRGGTWLIVALAGAAAHAQGVPAFLPPAGGARAALQVEKVGPEVVVAGQPLAYEVVVRNTGTVPALQVRVEDDLPPGARVLSAEPGPEGPTGLSWNLGTLAPGEERRVKVSVQPADEGEWSAAARVTFTTAPLLRTRVTRPGLSVTVAGPEAAAVGEAVPLQIVLTNLTGAPASGVLLQNRLSPGLSHPAGPDLEADIGTIPPGGRKEIPLQVKAAQPGRQTSDVTVSAAGGLKATASHAVRVGAAAPAPASSLPPPPPAAAVAVPAVQQALKAPAPPQAPGRGVPSLSLKTAVQDPALAPGEETTFTVRLVNQGTGAATGVGFSVEVPDGLTLVRASGPLPYRVAGQLVLFEPLASLGPRGDQVYEIRVRAVKPGDKRFRARVKADQSSGPLTQDDVARVYEGAGNR